MPDGDSEIEIHEGDIVGVTTNVQQWSVGITSDGRIGYAYISYFNLK